MPKIGLTIAAIIYSNLGIALAVQSVLIQTGYVRTADEGFAGSLSCHSMRLDHLLQENFFQSFTMLVTKFMALTVSY